MYAKYRCIALLCAMLALGGTVPVSATSPLPVESRNPTAAPATPPPGLPPRPTLPATRPAQGAPAAPTVAATPAPKPPPRVPNTPFVSRQGGALYLDGRPWHAVGMNISLDTRDNPYQGCGDAYADGDVDAVYAQFQASGVTIDVAWATQGYLMHRDGSGRAAFDFSRLDYMVRSAARHNVRLILGLGEQWGVCDDGVTKARDWYTRDYAQRATGSYAIPGGLPYKDFALMVARRYRDATAVMAYDLIVEPQSYNQDYSYDPAILTSFAADMGAAIKGVDPNHLIGVGAMDGHFRGADYDRINSLPGVDLLLVDDYAPEAISTSSHPWDDRGMDYELASAARVGIPLIVLESGLKTNCADADCYSYQRRADLLDTKMRAQYAAGEAAICFWGYTVGSGSGVGNIYADDPLMARIKAFMAQYP